MQYSATSLSAPTEEEGSCFITAYQIYSEEGKIILFQLIFTHFKCFFFYHGRILNQTVSILSLRAFWYLACLLLRYKDILHRRQLSFCCRKPDSRSRKFYLKNPGLIFRRILCVPSTPHWGWRILGQGQAVQGHLPSHSTAWSSHVARHWLA